jgi:hypothetical protein
MTTPVDPLNPLKMGMEQYLRDLSDDEFTALMQTVRPPADHTPQGSTSK